MESSKNTFTGITGDTQCDCLAGAVQNTEALFVKSIDSRRVKERDFRSKWEKGHRQIDGRPVDESDCRLVCMMKGVSVNMITTSESEENAIQKYKKTLKYSPKRPGYLLKFRFCDNAGAVKYTPNGNDKTHHTFYKSDSFALDLIDVIDIKALKREGLK